MERGCNPSPYLVTLKASLGTGDEEARHMIELSVGAGDDRGQGCSV